MSKFESILKSFHSKDNLNSKIWKESGNDITINPTVRKKLLEIANEFIEFLKVDIVVSDIIMTGSLANYNWSEFSDIDLHIVVDFGQFSKEQLPLYEELFRLKKTLFNEKHDITIYGYEVELYVQNESESHFSSGVFSVLNDEWIVEPKKEDVKIDIGLIKNKAEQWMKIIDGVIENASDEPLDEAKKIISKYKDKLKKYRTCGLENGGEYSDENLVFKILRRNNYIQKLFDFETTIADKELSLNESRIKKLIREGSKDLPNIYVLHGEFTDVEMNELYNHPKVKAMVNLTKGEGYGRPLLEFSLTKKPIITTNWSGHTDFLNPEFTSLIPGQLTDVHPSAANNWLLKESQWLSVDLGHAGTTIKDIFEDYSKYIDGAKRQAYKSKNEFSWDKMKDKVDELFTKYIPEFPKQVQLQLPKLKKIELPKLQKVEK